MPFDTIERLGAAASDAAGVPPMGVRVAKRRLGRPGTNDAGYISILIGNALAARLGLREAGHPVSLAFGNGNDAGKIAITVGAGDFAAKGKPGKPYQVSINRVSAEGLFAWQFSTFERTPLEAIRPERGGGAMTVFTATAEMLAVED